VAEPMDAMETSDLLFSYAAGTLDPAARQRVEAMLDADPRLRDELKWYEAVCDGVIESLPPLKALPKAEDVLKRTREQKQKRDIPSARGWWAWLMPTAAALIVVQSIAIGYLLGDRQEAQLYRSMAQTGGKEGKPVVFVIAFNPDTPESKVRALLLKAGATIVDGPKQLGDYRVSVPLNRAQYALQLFQDSGIAEYVRKQE